MEKATKQEDAVRLHVKAGWAGPVLALVLFGGIGTALLVISIARDVTIAPGVGILILGLVLFIGLRAYRIEILEDTLVYRRLGGVRVTQLNEIREILITEGFDSFGEMFTKPRIRIEIHHTSDTSKNIYIASSIGIFHPREVHKVLAFLAQRGISIREH